MRLLPIFLTAVMCWCVLPAARSQNFGGNPASLRWKQINTPSARIVFPKGLDSTAARIATLTDLLAQRHRATVGPQVRKVDVVLRAQNTYSNAYVGLGPWRSEFYLTPPQDPFMLGSLRWADNLAIHEFRHVQQYSNYNRGLSRFFSVLGGEYGQAFANALTVPDWFFEGDAVWNETALSRQGRGRLANFYNPYKSLFSEGRQYSYMKLRNGSLRSMVPNHYDLGYLLVSYARQNYGDSIWLNIARDAAAFKGLFYPFQKAVKRYTGRDFKRFTQEALQYFHQQWGEKQSVLPDWLTGVEKNNVVNYQYAYPAADGAVIALKTSLRQVPFFVKLNADGKEKKIAVRDIGYDDYYSYNNGRIIYTALKPDARWGNRDFSAIRLLDVATQEVSTIKTNSKYFSPDISSDGQSIVAVEVQPAQPAQLKLLNRQGQVLKAFTADSALFYSHPKFLENGTDVVVAARTNSGYMGWLIWHSASGTSEWLLTPADRVVAFPVVRGAMLYYSGTAGKHDALYALDMRTKQYEQVAAYTTGIYQGFEQDGKIKGSVFTSNGYRLAAFQKQSTKANDLLEPLYTPAAISGYENITAAATRHFESKPYRKLHRPFNFHSWLPSNDGSDYTFTLYGQNVLATLDSRLQYTFNTQEKSSQLGYQGLYGGTYVQPFVSVQQTWNREIALNKDSVIHYRQTEAGLGLQLPLNLSFGKFYRYLTLSSSVNTERVGWTGTAKKQYQNLDFNYVSGRLRYTSQMQKAVQQIYPHFAQTILADYRSIIDRYTAHQLLLSASVYLPGLFNTHSLVITGAYQSRDTLRQYLFSNSFPFSRGYTSLNYPRMIRMGVNYHLPVCYPDWGFGQMAYFRRIRANLFYDFTQVKSIRTGLSSQLNTLGSELYFDTKVWNQQPIIIGLRYSRLLNASLTGQQANQWEIILPIDLIP